MEMKDKIKEYWDKRALDYSGTPAATTNDVYLRELEISNIIQTLHQISINRNGQPDRQSYRITFDYFNTIAPTYAPRQDLQTTVSELKSGLEAMGFHDRDFRNSSMMRLNVLSNLIERGFLTRQLEWTSHS